jgi:hypothetical protein
MAVSGPISRRLSEDAIAALAAGDIDALMRIEREEFGGFAVMMADEPDDDDDDDDDDNPAGGGDDDDDDDDKGKKDDDVESRLEAMRKRMKAADKRADEAAAALKKREDAEKGELEKATETVTELQSKVETLTTEVNDLRLQNAFLSANKHPWHDPEVALTLARSKKYLEDVVDDDGEVDKAALGKALDRLAKEHKYLVADSKQKDDTDEDNPSGEPAGRRSNNGKDDKAKKAALRGRFPALNR